MHIREFPLPGFTIHGSETRYENGLEDRLALYRIDGRELVAAFSSTTRTSNGEQCVNTNSQFVQRNYLTKAEIDAVTVWLEELARSARHRLTTYTVMVEARP